MSFLNPEIFYYMLAPYLILFALLLTQKEAEAHFFSDEVMAKLRVSANTLTLKARNALFFLMGLLFIVALAQPVIKDGKIQVKAKSSDIMIALDISDSMLANDVYPNRLELAKQKALNLLKIAPNERIGIIAFAKNSYLVSPLSFDHKAVSFLLSQLNTNSITEKGTNYLSMLEVFENSLEEKSKRYLLVFSDGADDKDFSKEIAYAKEKDIVVFVVGMGTEKGSPVRLDNGSFVKQNGDIIVSKLNENISEFATQTGGVYVQNSTSQKDVELMLSEIVNLSDKKELKSEEVQKYIPLFYYPLGLGMIILLIATSSMSKREVVHLPSAFILFALLFINPHAKAGMLDFLELQEAKKAYEHGDYEKSAKLYEKHAQETKNPQSYFNAANSFYKQKKYEEAIKFYNKSTPKNVTQIANNYANIANAYAKQGTEEKLHKAIEFYEKSLKIKKDKPTQENLEAVRKALKEKENKQDKKQDKKQDEQKDSQDKKSSKSDKKQDSKDKSSKDSQDKKSSKSDKKQDSKDKSSKDSQDKQENSQNDSSSDEKNKEKEQNKDETKNEENKDTNSTKPQKRDEKTQKLNEDNNESSSPKNPHAKKELLMSDEEAQKWIDKLNEEQNTYMYKLNKQKPKQENTNEKPW